MRYSDRYPLDPAGKGLLGPILGSPSYFKSQFDDAGCQWVGVVDDDGNPWFLLVKSSTAQYNWAEVRKRDLAGYAPMLPDFERAEQLNAAANGFAVEPRFYGLVAPRRYGTMTERQPYGPDRVVPNTAVILDPGGTLHTYEFADNPEGNPYTARDYGGMPVTDLGPTGMNPDVCRSEVICVFTVGGHKQSVYANVNTRLRIGYITGFPGRVGEDPIEETIKTLIDVAKIVVGVFTANVGIIVSAAADIVVTWYAYEEAKAAVDAAAVAAGEGLADQGVGGTGTKGPAPGADPSAPSVPFPPELALVPVSDVDRGTSRDPNRATLQARLAWVRKYPPLTGASLSAGEVAARFGPVLPTVGQLAAHAQQKSAGKALGLGFLAWLVFA